MKFIKKIREDVLKKNPYEMHKLIGLRDTRAWLDFEKSKNAVNVKYLIRLWQLTELSADELMQMLVDEVEEN